MGRQDDGTTAPDEKEVVDLEDDRAYLHPMTQLLEKAVAKASALPDSEQDALASVLLSELESEQRWDQLFAFSQDVLGLMAREALEEYRAGQTAPLDLERDFPKN